MNFWEILAQRITTETSSPFLLLRHEETGGGCINRGGVVWGRDDRRFYVKFNDAGRLDMFEAESEGLRELAKTGAVSVPRPVCAGSGGGRAFLVLEYLELIPANDAVQETLGRQLAALHRVTSSHFGWTRDNTIGSTSQINKRCDDWVEFYRERRLQFQLALAAKNGAAARLQEMGAELLERLHTFFTNYRPVASLLHGDLWSGNAAATRGGEAVIFDPAVYFGDREADLAMTELFGGFGQRFYSAYREAWPLDEGYTQRRTLYNLYHTLNHFNLFGGGYGEQAQHMLQRLLNEVR